MITNVGNPVQPCAQKLEKLLEELENKPADKNHFINFKIVDDKGVPLKDVILEVILPDGSGVQKISDDKGEIQIKGIDSGKCQVVSNWKIHQVDDTVLFQ